MNPFRFLIMSLSIVLAALSIVACSDSSDHIKDDVQLLPATITTQRYLNDEPGYRFTYITTYKYDNQNRPIEIKDITYRKSVNNMDNSLGEETYINTSTLTYLDEGNKLIKRVDNVNYLQTNSQYKSFTRTREYSMSEEGNIDISLNNKYEESIELDNKGFAVKFSTLILPYSKDEEVVANTTNYTYDNKGNIVQYNDERDNQLVSARQHTYDSYNGINKHVNAPQWLVVTMISRESLTNNAKSISVSKDDAYVPYANNEYRYNKYGYPEYKAFYLGSGGSNSQTTIDYIRAKEIIE